jgi:DNA-binding MurR/RpiR family transcriptional regulator
MPDLTRAESRLAQALLASYPLAGLEPIPRLAARASVSGPTVLRLVAKLGFSGFPAFQQALREEVQARLSSPAMRYPPHVPPLPPGGMAAARLQSMVQNLEAAAAAMEGPAFEATVELLADRRRRVLAVGGWISQVLAAHLVSYLRLLRPRVHLLDRSATRLVDDLLDVSRRDVLVTFDHRRYQKDTVQFALEAARRGACVVLVTDPLLSPVATVARHVFTFPSGSAPPFETWVGGMAIVELLAAGVAERLGEAGRVRLEQRERFDQAWTWEEAAPR